MKPSEIVALIAGSLVAVSVYAFLTSWLMGGPAVAGMVGAAVIGLLGVVAGGTFVEALVLTTIMSGVVGAVFGLTSPPPFIGHAVLVLVSGVAGGKLIAAVHDVLAPTRYDADPPKSARGSFASKPADAGAPDPTPGGPPDGRGRVDTERPTDDTTPLEPGAADPNANQSPIAEFTQVRFVRIESFDRWWTAGVDKLARPPRVGDKGIVVDAPEDPAGLYTAEVADNANATSCTTEARRSELRVRQWDLAVPSKNRVQDSFAAIQCRELVTHHNMW